MTPEERDRLTRMETKFDERWAELTEVLKSHTQQLKDHGTFIDGLKMKMAIVGMGFTLFGSVFMLGLNWLLEKLSIGWGP